MVQAGRRPRVLLAASASDAFLLNQAFEREPLNTWELLQAESLAQTRHFLQHNQCDVVLIYEDSGKEVRSQKSEAGDRRSGIDWDGLAWVTRNEETPVVLLSGGEPWTFARAYQEGVQICLPRDGALVHPPLLASALQRALAYRELRQGRRREGEKLNQARRQVDRLVGLIWRTTPGDSENYWFTQRYMLERLHEELARSRRHAIPLTVALSEVHPLPPPYLPHSQGEEREGGTHLPDWTSSLVLRGKRRSDVAGQYGLNGFMLILVHTPKEGGITCCRRLQKTLEESSPSQGFSSRVRAYFGLASTSAHGNTPQALLRHAEENLEAARTNKNPTSGIQGNEESELSYFYPMN